jgi:hypothetical protein
MYTQLGPTGPSGVVNVTSPITNSGTSTSAQLGFDQDAQNTTNDGRYTQTSTVARWSNQSSIIVETAPRYAMSTSTLASGTVYWSFFTPLVTTTVSSISMASGAVVSSGLTLARMGLYTFDETTATLVARTASDTTLFNVASTVYNRSFNTTGGYPATYTLQAGQRYGQALICVGTTMPTIAYNQVASTGVVAALTPRITGIAGSQSDLPTSRNTFTNTIVGFYGRLL